MSLFHSDNEKEEKHGGILGAFSVDNIKWEPGNNEDASLVSFRYPYEDFPNGSYLQSRSHRLPFLPTIWGRAVLPTLRVPAILR
ncbi:hypothetical protein [Collinsella aerofaciens]|uniref:hypothetical protein n=1 Tax=Collinsella aerofaciens TaxID=74426 RepID=UPI003219577F